MLRFFEAFPISAARRKLSWTHYRTLSRLPDKKKRLEIESRATRENWDSRKLEKHIRFLTAGATNATPSQDEANGGRPQGRPRRVQLLEPKRGKPGIYRIVADGDSLAVDLGFTSYQALRSEIGNRKSEIGHALTPGGLVTLARNGQPAPAPDATKAGLYTV